MSQRLKIKLKRNKKAKGIKIFRKRIVRKKRK